MERVPDGARSGSVTEPRLFQAPPVRAGIAHKAVRYSARSPQTRILVKGKPILGEFQIPTGIGNRPLLKLFSHAVLGPNGFFRLSRLGALSHSQIQVQF